MRKSKVKKNFLVKTIWYNIVVSVLSLEFVLGLAQFNSRDDEERRLQFIFRIYDMDRDGYISNGELFQVCHAISKYIRSGLSSKKSTIAKMNIFQTTRNIL